MKKLIEAAYRFSLPFRISKRRNIITLLFGVAASCFVTGYFLFKIGDAAVGFTKDDHVAEVLETPASVLDQFFTSSFVTYDELKPSESLFGALMRMGLANTYADRFVSAIGKNFNLKNLHPEDVIMLKSEPKYAQLGDVAQEAFQKNIIPAEITIFSKNELGVAVPISAYVSGDEIKVAIATPEIYKAHDMLSGKVTSSIYNTIIASGGDAMLVNSFADIFAWQFDFYRDSRDGDNYSIVVERNVYDGRAIGFGKILAAEYINRGKKLRGFYFQSSDGRVSDFFDEEGRSLKAAFLKAPLKLASIGSRFGMRFHPIQKRLKPHNGVDYGAKRGTPFMAVASGVVTNAGYTPFNGNWVALRHQNGYETVYLHATKLAKHLKVGDRVTQGQVIGYVGRTGMATGDHLHFGMRKEGKYVDPAKQKFTRSTGVPPTHMKEFRKNISPMVIALNNHPSVKGSAVAQLGEADAQKSTN